MINAQQCKDCDHAEVCGKRDQYKNFITTIENADIEQGAINNLYTKHFKDATADIHCNYFKTKSMIYVSLNDQAKDVITLTPEEFKNKMGEMTDTYDGDVETMHIEADVLMCDVLRELGYGDGIDIFKHMAKWYS